MSRTPNGQFTTGNPGGPGRPRRAVERDYLAALSEAVPLPTWREIVSRAAGDAKAGDAKAREFLAKYLLGSNPGTLLEIAGCEACGESVEHIVGRAAADYDRYRRVCELFDDLAPQQEQKQ